MSDFVNDDTVDTTKATALSLTYCINLGLTVQILILLQLVKQVYQLTLMGPARWCLTLNRPSRCIQIPADVECDQQPAIVDDCRSHLPRLPSLPAGAVNNRPIAVAVYVTRTRRRSACCGQFFKVQILFWSEVPLFLEILSPRRQ